MSQDIFELLKEKEQENQKEKKFYVYYDSSTEEIIHFRNYLEEDLYPFIVVSESDIDCTLDKFNPSDYRVLNVEKKLKLIKNERSQFNIKNVIHLIPKVIINNKNQIKNYQYDIIIEQNNKDRVFQLKLSTDTKEKFILQKSLKDLRLNVYVTAENDPHILYQTLEFKIEDLLKNGYHKIPFDDFNEGKCNLFSNKYFQEYLHVDIQ